MGIKLKFLMTALPYHAGQEATFDETERAYCESMIARGQAEQIGEDTAPEDSANITERLPGIEEPESADAKRTGGFDPEGDQAVKTAEAVEAGKGQVGDGKPAGPAMGSKATEAPLTKPVTNLVKK